MKYFTFSKKYSMIALAGKAEEIMEVILMIETIIEVLIIAGTLVCASLQMRKDALKARRVYAIAFVLMIAVCIAFGVAQGAVAAGIFYAALSFSPIEVLSLVAVIYWISFITEKGKVFNKVIGE